MSKNNSVGVIVGRFQVHELHEGHHDLIQQVIEKHKKVILFLGVPRTLSTVPNPLDFVTRKKMIEEYFPDITIIAIQDQYYNHTWSVILDNRIKEIYPKDKVILYGSRDSFIDRYDGIHGCEEIKQTIFVSGTEIRKNISYDIKSSPDFRAGVIWGINNTYPSAIPTVDIAIFKESKLLLAKKPDQEKYRFVGGYVDPTDINYEAAARREIQEELKIEIDGFDYICTAKIDDWRYKNSPDQIITTLFKAEYIYGNPIPSDDISECRLFDLEELTLNMIVDEHHILFTELMSFIKRK